MADGINVSSAGVAVGSVGVETSTTAGGNCCCGACFCLKNDGITHKSILVTLSGILPCATIGVCNSDLSTSNKLLSYTLDGVICAVPAGTSSGGAFCFYAATDVSGILSYSFNDWTNPGCSTGTLTTITTPLVSINITIDPNGTNSSISIVLSQTVTTNLDPAEIFSATVFTIPCGGSVTLSNVRPATCAFELAVSVRDYMKTFTGGTATLAWSDCT